MMLKRRTNEEIYKKCELLDSLGFEVEHQDSRVTMHGVEFDFSATGCDVASIMYEALRQMKESARKEGVDHLRSDLKDLLGL